jgi:hypothetical protein
MKVKALRTIGLGVLVASISLGTVQAAVFLAGDGSNTAVVNVSGLPTGNEARSYLAWVNLTTGDILPNGGAIAAYGSINPFSGYHRSGFDIDPNGQLDLNFQVGYVTSSGISITNGQWHQVAATYDSNQGVLMYVDGVQVATANGVNGFNAGWVDTVNVNSNAVTFGFEYGVTNGSTDINTTALELQGNVADTSIWNTVLTPTEVLADYQSGGVLSNTNGLLAAVWGPVSTPEPSSIAVLGTGVLLVVAFKRFARRRSSSLMV